MPAMDSDTKPSWADQVEEAHEDKKASPQQASLPAITQKIDGKTKTTTEYKIEDGKKVKIVRTYRIEKRKASKTVAQRKLWKKFGDSEFSGEGPDPATTAISDDIFISFTTSKEEQHQSEEQDPLAKLKSSAKLVQCRICKGDHWTTKCPYKELEPLQKELASAPNLAAGEDAAAAATTGGAAEPAKVGGDMKAGKYVPPSMREGGNRRGESMANRRGGDDGATIRVTNLSEDTRESDLQDLFRPFGSISRIYLAKDKVTGVSKGFAFINFHRKEDAASAIKGVSGFGYDHLILNVEWAKPSGTT